jgi:hypothetical protein
MPVRYFIFIILLLIPSLLQGEEAANSIPATTRADKNPFFFSLKGESGMVFQTNDFVSDEGITGFSALSL